MDTFMLVILALVNVHVFGSFQLFFSNPTTNYLMEVIINMNLLLRVIKSNSDENILALFLRIASLYTQNYDFISHNFISLYLAISRKTLELSYKKS